MRPLVLFLLLPATLVSSLFLAHLTSSPLLRLRSPGSSSPSLIDSAAFQEAALQSVNLQRATPPYRASALALHPLATGTLDECIQSASGSTGDLQHVFDTLQLRCPQIVEAGSNLISGTSQGELLAALAAWPELTKPGYTHLATTVFRPPGQRQTLCLAAVLRELPRLHLPAPRHVPLDAYDICPICEKGQGLSLQPQTQSTLVIRCRHCQNPYNLLAADSSGNWRRANQFLEGLTEIKVDPELDPEDRVLAVWKQVDERCRYQYDPQRVSGEDSWNLPHQTYALTWGDCEDTSMLLADALISNGLEARVAMGRQKGRGHAWCIVRVGERQFILESTAEGVEHLRNLPYLDDVALNYEPEVQFDRNNIYFNRHHQWTSNYWSTTTWLRVNYPPETVSTVAAADP